jgi:alcohol dehydrogenase
LSSNGSNKRKGKMVDWRRNKLQQLLVRGYSQWDKRSFKVLKKGGLIVSMLEHPDPDLMNQYSVKAVFRFVQANRERLIKLAQWIDENINIRINVEKTFSLDQAGEALDYQKDVHPRGKLVLNV